MRSSYRIERKDSNFPHRMLIQKKQFYTGNSKSLRCPNTEYEKAYQLFTRVILPDFEKISSA